MQSEEQWELVGNCVHCNSPIYAMNGELRFTGGDCLCELRGLACLDTKRAMTRRGMARTGMEHRRPKRDKTLIPRHML